MENKIDLFWDHEQDSVLCAAFWGAEAEDPEGYLTAMISTWAENLNCTEERIVREMLAYLETQRTLAEIKTLRPFADFQDFALLSCSWVLDWIIQTDWIGSNYPCITVEL